MPNLPMPEGLGNPDLECVMLDIAPFEYMDRDWDYSMPLGDLFYGDIPELQYAQGLVGAKNTHVTLLFGIHPRSTYVQEVERVLDGWTPEPIIFNTISSFPSSIPGQDYNVIVAKVAKTTNLLEGHNRLLELDYTNSYPEYEPHVTLAYIKGSANVNQWIEKMRWVTDEYSYPVTRINNGLDD